MIRINKYLSMCGVTSRRGAEALINEGRVKLNGDVLTAVGTMVDETADVVLVDGVEAKPAEATVYVVFNKPPNVMTTLKDPFRRKTVVSFLKKLPHRVYPVGRLDYDTEGVLILTNDGELAFRLAHPKFQIPRIYEARVKGQFKPSDGEKIAAGLQLSDGAIGKAQVDILGFVKSSTRIRLTLTEGRKHEVKQLCALVGHPVEQLRRVEFAGIKASGLAIGEWRFLTPTELSRLRKAVGQA